MLAEESEWIKKVIVKLEPSPLKSIGNLGSSTLKFRTKVQPHIHENIIIPLCEKGFWVINVDLKKAEGIDVVGDIR